MAVAVDDIRLRNTCQAPGYIVGQYPSVRALVLARGNCILHEYYGYNSPDVQWPMHSVTKSVLSILVGIAIDKGLLRLDQKLPELVAEATEVTIDFARGRYHVARSLDDVVGLRSARSGGGAGRLEFQRAAMISRTIKYPPGTRFHDDDEATNQILIILRRAVGGNIGRVCQK